MFGFGANAWSGRRGALCNAHTGGLDFGFLVHVFAMTPKHKGRVPHERGPPPRLAFRNGVTNEVSMTHLGERPQITYSRAEARKYMVGRSRKHEGPPDLAARM